MAFDWKIDYYRYKRYFFDVSTVAKKPSFRSYFWLSLTLFTISFFVLMAIKPTLLTVFSLTKEIKDKQEAVVKLDKKIADVIKAQGIVADNSARLTLLDQAIPTESLFPQIAIRLEELATADNVELKSIRFNNINGQPGNTKAINGPSKVIFNILVTGDYLSLKNFLSDFEMLIRITIVNSINFSKQVKKEQDAVPDETLMLSIEGETYYVGPNK